MKFILNEEWFDDVDNDLSDLDNRNYGEYHRHTPSSTPSYTDEYKNLHAEEFRDLLQKIMDKYKGNSEERCMKIAYDIAINDKTLVQAAKELNVSPTRVRQLYMRGINLFRRNLKYKGYTFDDFFESLEENINNCEM